MFRHCHVKMTSYIKIFLIQGLKITLSTKFELDQVIILKIIHFVFFNGKHDLTHCKQNVAMATSDENGSENPTLLTSIRRTRELFWIKELGTAKPYGFNDQKM